MSHNQPTVHIMEADVKEAIATGANLPPVFSMTCESAKSGHIMRAMLGNHGYSTVFSEKTPHELHCLGERVSLPINWEAP